MLTSNSLKDRGLGTPHLKTKRHYTTKNPAKKAWNPKAYSHTIRSDAVGREVLQQILISCLHGKDVKVGPCLEQIGYGFFGDLGGSNAMIWMNTNQRELDLHFKQTGDMILIC